jgi:hypothetical protein
MAWFCFLHPGRAARVSYGVAFIAMGIGLEFAQRALGFRVFEVQDMLANAAGVILGWAAIAAASRIRRR